MSVGMRDPRRNRLIDALGNLAIRVGAGGGFILGALAGWQGQPRAVGCPADDVCVGELLKSTIWAGLVPAAAGAAAGLAASLVVVLVLRRLRRRVAVPEHPAGRPISARYAGRCSDCSAGVAVGDRVLHDRATRSVTCAACAG